LFSGVSAWELDYYVRDLYVVGKNWVYYAPTVLGDENFHSYEHKIPIGNKTNKDKKLPKPTGHWYLKCDVGNTESAEAWCGQKMPTHKDGDYNACS